MAYPNRVGERQCDSEGQTLGHGDHEHSDTNDEVVHEVVDVSPLPGLFVNAEPLHAELRDQDDHCEHCDRRSYKHTTSNCSIKTTYYCDN